MKPIEEYESHQIATDYNKVAESIYANIVYELYDMQNRAANVLHPLLEDAYYFTNDHSKELFKNVSDELVDKEIRWHKKHAHDLDNMYEELYNIYIHIADIGAQLNKIEQDLADMYYPAL